MYGIMRYQTPKTKSIKSVRKEIMTDSMIPYSFVPGTKAKADEVNANFISLANFIEQHKVSVASNVKKIDEILKTKADKTELINEHTVTDIDTDLNDYKTKGLYIFSNNYKPKNIPKGDAGMLLVNGDEKSVIKQIWYSNEENSEIFTRNFENNEWGKWYSTTGVLSLNKTGYLRLPDGLLIQWGAATGPAVKYPLAFEKFACPVCIKNGININVRADSGIATSSLTGFDYASSGAFSSLNWVVFGH